MIHSFQASHPRVCIAMKMQILATTRPHKIHFARGTRLVIRLCFGIL